MAEAFEKIVKILSLKYPPVSVGLIREGTAPEGFVRPQSRISYCQAVVEASLGKSLFVSIDNSACADGASALGLMKVPESIANGQVYHAMGIHLSQEKAKRSIARKPRFDLGACIGLTLCPLDQSSSTPDVVIVRATPEQAMWISTALSYDSEDRVDFLASGVNSACIESTVIPYVTKRMNVSLGCYGCRGRTELADCELLVGIPYNHLSKIIAALEALSRLIGQTRGKEHLTRHRQRVFSKARSSSEE